MNLLRTLFEKQIGEFSSEFEWVVSSYFIDGQIIEQKQFENLVEDCKWEESLFSSEVAQANWKRLLTLSVFCSLVPLDYASIAEKVRLFERYPWDQTSQYFRSIVALSHALSHLPVPEVGAHLLESGAALIDLHPYCPWLSLPYTPQHFEFGVFLCMLFLINKQANLKETVLRIAHWQLNTLGVEARPLPGLFVKEKEGRTLYHLCSSYLLFQSAALLDDSQQFATIAEITLQDIHAHVVYTGEKIDVLWALVENWLFKNANLSNKPSKSDLTPFTCSSNLKLPEQIYDPATALVGFRSAEQHVVCTLHGVQTGLGGIRQKDVEIVTYGPQYLPLGDCQGFGIQGNPLSDQGARRSSIELKKGAFVLKGCTRMPDQHSSVPSVLGKFRGIWLEIEQEYKKPRFQLNARFLSLEGWEGIAFSFFIKAKRCKIESRILSPRTLERYEGAGMTVVFEGEEEKLALQPLFSVGKMEIIPLAGGDDFWGADFLAAFHLSVEESRYQWQLAPLSTA